VSTHRGDAVERIDEAVMVKRFFLLATVTAIAGLFVTVEGCSSSETTTTTDADAGDSGSTKPAPREASVDPVVDSGPAVCPPTDPITAADLSAWMPPPPVQDVCNQANIDALKAAFNASTTGVKYTDIKTALGTDCSACVFSPLAEADGGATPNWSIFVETNGGAIDNREGSCFARLSDTNCGKNRYLFEACLRAACTSADCGSDSAVTACKKAVQNGACKDITTAYVAACPNETALLDQCNTYSSIAYGCSGGLDGGAEGGIDASN
jgi:hypothetical protein